jgi:hypothetical protein
MFSTSGPFWEATGELPAKSRFLTIKPFGMTRAFVGALSRALTHATVWPSDRNPDATFDVHFRQPDTEDKKLRKDPFGGPCFEGTLRKSFLSE